MSEQHDPFSFLPLPKAADHVNDAFSRLRLTEVQMPTFHAFLVQALTPVAPLTHQTAESYTVETCNRLHQIVSDIALAQSKCTPYYQNPWDIPEYFMIVAAMPSLENLGYTHLKELMRDQYHAEVMVNAHRLFMVTRAVDRPGPTTRSLFPTLSPSEKLMVELKACLLAREAVIGIQKERPENVLATAFGIVARFRPLMQTSDTAMARQFRMLDQMIHAHMTKHGAPGQGQAPFGSRLREELRNLGMGPSEEAPAAAESPVPGPAAERTVVPFRRTRREPA